MSRFPRIESRQNPRIKSLVRLKNARDRTTQGRFIVEGELEVARAFAAERIIPELFLCPDHWRDGDRVETIISQARLQHTKITELPPEVFAKVSLREGADGVLAVASHKPLLMKSLKLPDEPLLVIVEKIEKPGNLGALIRTAEAAGAHALIACDAVADFENPQVIRNSRGLVFSLPCVHSDREQLESFLEEKGIRTIATTPHTELEYWDAPMAGPLAVLAGAEHDGLSDYWLERASAKVRIPMEGSADSLNVNIATAVVLFEALRQRRD
ncbi:MAG: RNA methyltransferase [Verrucomicrobiota bacterium]